LLALLEDAITDVFEEIDHETQLKKAGDTMKPESLKIKWEPTI